MAIDIKEVLAKAKEEIEAEKVKAATLTLRELLQRLEKAKLVVKNIERDIETYVAKVEEELTYASAGVDTSKE